MPRLRERCKASLILCAWTQSSITNMASVTPKVVGLETLQGISSGLCADAVQHRGSRNLAQESSTNMLRGWLHDTASARAGFSLLRPQIYIWQQSELRAGHHLQVAGIHLRQLTGVIREAHAVAVRARYRMRQLRPWEALLVVPRGHQVILAICVALVHRACGPT